MGVMVGVEGVEREFESGDEGCRGLSSMDDGGWWLVGSG